MLYTAGQAEYGRLGLAVRNPRFTGQEVRVATFALPKIGAGPMDAPDEEPRLNLSVGVSKAGYQVQTSGATATGAEGPAALSGLPALYSRLVALKADHPDETLMALTADEHVRLAKLLQVMDVARWRLTEDRYDSADALRAAEPRRDETGRPEHLFPDVLLTVGLLPPASPQKHGAAAVAGGSGVLAALRGSAGLSGIFSTKGDSEGGTLGSAMGGDTGGLGQRGIGGSGGQGYGSGGAGLGSRPALRDKKARANRMAGGKPAVTGSLDASVIRRVVRRHQSGIKFCYQRQLSVQPKLSGKIVVEFVIAATGRVLSASIEESSMGNKAVESCIVRRVRTWRFPTPKGGGVVKVRYPFVFKAG